MKYLEITQSKGLVRFIRMGLLIIKNNKNKVPFNESLKDSNNIGQLAFKKEAAGKVRVFAMVDVITQSVLKPLHDHLFDIFRRLPNDGTHDQSRAFRKALDLSVEFNCSYGYDLSAATDRLPISVQSTLLNSMFQSNIGDL